MQRPIGIFVAGVILLISGLLGLLVCGLAFLSSMAAQSAQMAAIPYERSILLVTGIIFVLIDIFLCWVAVDLFRMRSWARYAVIILAALGACCCGFSAVMMVLLQHLSLPNPNLSPQMLHGILDALAVLYFVLAAIALFWVFYFNRAPIRAAFAATAMRRYEQGANDGITLSTPQHKAVGLAQAIVWINAVLWLMGAVYLVVVLCMGAPLFLFGWLATGAAAFLAGVLLACFLVYGGLGLIFRWRAGWYLAIALQLFGLLSVLALLIPGYTERFFAASQAVAMRFDANAAAVSVNSQFLAVVSALEGFVALIVLAALIRCRRSYLS